MGRYQTGLNRPVKVVAQTTVYYLTSLPGWEGAHGLGELGVVFARRVARIASGSRDKHAPHNTSKCHFTTSFRTRSCVLAPHPPVPPPFYACVCVSLK